MLLEITMGQDKIYGWSAHPRSSSFWLLRNLSNLMDRQHRTEKTECQAFSPVVRIGPTHSLISNPLKKLQKIHAKKVINCSARDWDGKDYLRIIPRVVLVEDPRLT
jgi:hypothetical protein